MTLTSDSPASVVSSRALSLALGQGGAGLSAAGVTGEISEGQAITISQLSGEDFGSGQATEFYTGSFGKSAGATFVDGDQEYGALIDTPKAPPSWDAGGLYTKPKLRINNPVGMLRVDFAPVTEVFMSCWVYIAEPITSFAASYKLFWLADGGDGFGTDAYDLVLLTKQSSVDRLAYAGNASNGTVLQSPNGLIPSGQWFHFSGWVKDNGASEMGAFLQIAKAGAQIYQKIAPDTPGQLMLSGTGSTSVSRLHLLGDSNANNGADIVDTWVDHFYLAAGNNARARVEIGNAQSYTDCTELFPVTIDSWGAQIQGKVWHPSPAGMYLHIHKGDGTHAAGGTGRLIQ